jgi:hypothetical protein
MTPIFGDVSFKEGQFGHLMPAWLSGPLAAFRCQRVLTMTARVGKEIDDRVHPFDWHQPTTVARAAGLPTGLPPTLLPAASHALLPRQTIR